MSGIMLSAATRLVRRPAYFITASLVLGFGLAANLSVWTMARAVIWHEPTEKEPARLRYLAGQIGGTPRTLPFQSLGELQASLSSFGEMAAHASDSGVAYFAGSGAAWQGELVSSGYFDVLGVSGSVGRLFSKRDGEDLAVVVISHRLWQRHFGGDKSVVGVTIRLDPVGLFPTMDRGQYYTVVGVTPESFRGTLGPGRRSDYWVLARTRARDYVCAEPQFWNRHGVTAIVRLTSSWSDRELTRALQATGARVRSAEGLPEAWRLIAAHSVADVSELAMAGVRPARIVGASLAVSITTFLVALAHFITLGRVRNAQRRRELAIHVALGASRRDLAVTLLVEHLATALVAGLWAILLTGVAVRVFVATVPPYSGYVLPWDLSVEASGSWAIVPATLLMCAVIGLLGALGSLLTLGWRGGTFLDPRALDERSGGVLLVAPQLWVCMSMLITGGAVLQAAQTAQVSSRGDWGGSDVAIMSFQQRRSSGCVVGGAAEAQEDPWEALAAGILRRAREIPGVSAAALALDPPSVSRFVWIAPAEDDEVGQSHRVTARFVTEDYFDVMALRVAAGVGSEALARRGGVVISEALARDLWPGLNPVGRRVSYTDPGRDKPPMWLPVEGVVADPLDSVGEPTAVVYGSVWRQARPEVVFWRGGDMSGQGLERAASAIQSQYQTALFGRPATLWQIQDEATYPYRISSTVLSLGGLLALGLASVGLYACTAFAVVGRRRELAIRTALGATGIGVRWLVLRSTVVVAMAASMGSLATAWVALRFLQRWSPELGLSFGSLLIVCACVGTSLVAAWLPTRRVVGAALLLLRAQS